MSKNDPGYTHIFELTGASLSGVGTSSGKTAVLCSNLNVAPQTLQADGNVNEGNTDNSFGISRDGSGTVELSDDLFARGDSTIGLPVSTEEVLASSFSGIRALGGASGAGAAISECHD